MCYCIFSLGAGGERCWLSAISNESVPDQSVTFKVFVVVNEHFVITPFSNNCSCPIFFQINFKIKESLSNECAVIAHLIPNESIIKCH